MAPSAPAFLLLLLTGTLVSADPWARAFRSAEAARASADQAAERRALTRARDLAGESWLRPAGPTPDGRLPATLAALAALERRAGRPQAARDREHELLRHLRAHPHPGGHAQHAQVRRLARLELSEGGVDTGARLAREALSWARAHPHALDDVEQAETWALEVQLATHPEAELALEARRDLLRSADRPPTWTPFADEVPLRIRLHQALASRETTPEDRAFHAARAAALATPGDPDEAVAWPHLHAVGRAAARAHDLSRAAAWLRRATTAPDATPRQRADSLVDLARLSEVCDGCALPDPVDSLRRAHELRREELGPWAPATLDAWAARARHLARRRGELEPLRVALDRLAEVRTRAGDPAGASDTFLELADLARQAGDVPGTLASLEKARAAADAAAPQPATPAAARRIEKVAFRHAATLRALGRHADEAEAWQAILPAMAQAYGPGHRRHAWRQLSVAEARERAGDLAGALAAARPALAALREAGPALALEYALDMVARLEEAQGDAAAAAHRAEALAWARAQDPLANAG